MSAHVIVADVRDGRHLLSAIQEGVHDHFGIDHITIQLEPEGFQEPNAGF